MPKNRNSYEGEPRAQSSDRPVQPIPFPVRLIHDFPLEPAKVHKTKQPTEERSDHFYPAWDKFVTGQPTRSKVATKPGKELQQEKDLVEKKLPQGLRIRENAALSWQEAADACKKKVAAIGEECQRLNQKYRDALFDLECNDYCLRDLAGDAPDAVEDLGPPPWIKRVEDIFEKPEFLGEDATVVDIHQGNAGDCWFIAALAAVSAKRELVERLCVAKNEKVGVYGFVFYRGECLPVERPEADSD